MTATGSDETLAAIRAQLPVKTRFLGYGHRVSFGFVAGEVLYGSNAKKIAVRAADDVVAWNQLGCLSPHVIYVSLAAKFSRNISRSCWPRNWKSASKPNRAENCQLNTRQ